MTRMVCCSSRFATLAAAVCVLFLQLSATHGSTLLRGENRTCRDYADLDYGLTHPSSLYTKHSAGESLVAAEDGLEKWWSEYRRYGGDAKKPAVRLAVN